MKRILLSASLLMLITLIVPAQNNGVPDTAAIKKKSFGITFNGYIKTDILYDSRQVVGARDNQFLLYPEPLKKDADGNDINARSEFNILAIQSRLSGTITGPDAIGAKTSGYLEAEFFGNINQNINTLRLRHAYLKLNWKNTEFMAGQTWHPMFSPLCFPNTVSFNTGVMFTVFSRNPQVRITQTFGNVSFSLSALSQIDFTSNGPEGPTAKYLRNSGIPELDFQVMYRKKNDITGTEFLIGAGMDYLMLVPRLSSSVTIPVNIISNTTVTYTYKTDEQIRSLSLNVVSKLAFKKVSFKAGAFYGENGYGFSLLGGYAVKSITDSSRLFVDYTNIRTMTAWGEIASTGKKWQPAIFGGFSRNLGSDSQITGAYYSRGADIDYLYRISPRLTRDFNKFRIAGELEYTVAAYGKTNGKGYVFDSEEIGNIRVLIGVYYFF